MQLFESKWKSFLNENDVSDYLSNSDNLQPTFKSTSNPYNFLDNAMQSLNGGKDPEYREMSRLALDSFEKDNNVKNLYSTIKKMMDKHQSIILDEIKKDLKLRIMHLIQDDMGVDPYDYESEINDFVDSNFQDSVKPVLDAIL